MTDCQKDQRQRGGGRDAKRRDSTADEYIILLPLGIEVRSWTKLKKTLAKLKVSEIMSYNGCGARSIFLVEEL